ncbi:MAG: hypothetical protein JSW07_02575 [bacterium]|nr:MAG: hypothetical protein JSW07_02575 [bacterium]
MWKILKAQLQYNQIVLIISYLIFLSIYISFVVQGWQELDNSFPALRTVLMATTVMLFLFSIIKLYREKRDRFHHILTLNIWELGISRVLQIIVFWISILILVLFAFVLRPSIFDMKILWDLSSLTGFVLVMNAAPFIYRDLSYCFHAKSKKVVLVIVYALMIMAGYLLFMLFVVSAESISLSNELVIVKTNFSNFINTFMGALLFNLCGIILTVISLYVFSKRKTYTE